jgi:predicted nucleic acid-binding protein
MKVFLDTSVLVAACVRSHPHYLQALPALERIKAGKDSGFISNHSIAEVFAGLTRLPVVPRIHPTEATRIITANFLPYLETVAADQDDYLLAVSIMEQGGWSGAKIYDALLLACAAKCEADRIYTFNLSDFRALAPPALQHKVCAP